MTAPLPPFTQQGCAKLRGVLSLVGDKWSVLIVTILGGQPRRFSELKRMIEGISQRMLTLTLRSLERDGLVTRTVTPTIPPRVDYRLTELGRSLCEPVEALSRWASDHIADIDRARAGFDRRAGGETAQHPPEQLDTPPPMPFFRGVGENARQGG